MASNDKYYFQYEWTIDILFAGSGDSIKPFRLKSAVEEADYHGDFFPSLQMIIEVRRSDIMQIYKNQLKSFFHVTRTVYKYLMSNPSGPENSSNPELVSQDTDLDETFVPLFKQDDFPKDIRESDFENDAHTDGDGTMAQRAMDINTYPLDVLLYSAKGLAANKDSLINAVLHNCKPGTALGFIVDASTCEAAIVDKPDNETEYGDLILLPYNLRNSLWSLQVHYGIYKDSLVTFFDFECLYILNKFAGEHEFARGDKQYTYVLIHEPPEKAFSPALIRETNDSIEYTVSAAIQPMDFKPLIGELEGSKVLVTNYQMALKAVISQDGKVTGFNPAATVIERQTKSHEKSGSKVSIEYDELNNLINMASFNRERAPHQIVALPIPGAAASSFKPNKIFVLEFADKNKQQDMGGKYTPVKVRLEYTPTDPSNKKMICAAHATLMSLKD